MYRGWRTAGLRQGWAWANREPTGRWLPEVPEGPGVQEDVPSWSQVKTRRATSFSFQYQPNFCDQHDRLEEPDKMYYEQPILQSRQGAPQTSGLGV